MAVTCLQMVSRLSSVTGLPEDIVENVIHVKFPADPSPTEVIACLAAFGNFYIATPTGGTNAVGKYMAQQMGVSPQTSTILAYSTTDLSGGTPFGSPIGTSTFSFPTRLGSGLDLPEEVAVVCSYNGDLTDVPITEANPSPPPATIRPAQRRRGRMYVGPLSSFTVVESSQIPRPTSLFRTDLGLAFKTMCNGITSGTTGDVAVWSKADAALYPVVAGYVDDAWDIQRRRGPRPTTRTTFTV